MIKLTDQERDRLRKIDYHIGQLYDQLTGVAKGAWSTESKQAVADVMAKHVCDIEKVLPREEFLPGKLAMLRKTESKELTAEEIKELFRRLECFDRSYASVWIDECPEMNTQLSAFYSHETLTEDSIVVRNHMPEWASKHVPPPLMSVISAEFSARGILNAVREETLWRLKDIRGRDAAITFYEHKLLPTKLIYEKSN